MKKISYKDFAYLMNYELRHPFIKYCCNCYVIEQEADVFMQAKVKLWAYILLFIPINIIEFFYSLWNSGIKNYEIWESTIISKHRSTIYDEKYKEWKERSGM